MIRAIVAFLASVLTGVQAFLIIAGRDGICLNDGCEIVDSIPKVPPLYFNIAGLVFFLVLSWCFLKGRRGSEYWYRFAKLLLLAGLAAEGVLFFYQYSIVSVFCSYCLIILSIILLLNILSGLRQLFTSLVLFVTVFAMLSAFELRGGASFDVSLDTGSYARIGEETKEVELYLFFSETCEHCENVISIIGEDNSCNIRFNPVGRIEHFSLPGSTRFPDYNPGVNTLFMKSLNLKEIPVLVIRDEERIVVLNGEGRIKKYLNDECLGVGKRIYSETSQLTSPGYGYLPVPNQMEEGCSVENDCEESNQGGPVQKLF